MKRKHKGDASPITKSLLGESEQARPNNRKREQEKADGLKNRKSKRTETFFEEGGTRNLEGSQEHGEEGNRAEL